MKRLEDGISLPKTAECQFLNDERVEESLPLVERLGKDGIIMTKMIDPEGNIDQDHAGSGCQAGESPCLREKLII